MKTTPYLYFGVALVSSIAFQLGCSDGSSKEDDAGTGAVSDEPLDGVFIQPYELCQPPVEGDTVPSEDGEVCTNVAISGSTEEGRLFVDYASCDVVLTQRPYWESDPFGETPENNPRLSDSDYMREVEWLGSQVRSSGCICCHDSAPGQRTGAVWDVGADGIWLDALSDQGLAILAGKVPSQILGAYPPEDNNGFDRYTTGFPTTDITRATAFLNKELERRGIGDEKIAEMESFGDFLLAVLEEESVPCETGEGIDADGTVRWTGAGARYVYVMTPDAKNPGVPPNLDNPDGTLWRLDMKNNYQPLSSGISYGSLPEGSYQVTPETGEPPALEKGKTYKLYVLKDILQPRANCTFTAQ